MDNFKNVKKKNQAKEKLWAKRSYQSADLLVTFGYILGGLPVYWNRKQHQMELIQTKWEKFRWLLTMGLITIMEISVMIGYIIKVYFAPDAFNFIMKHIIQTSVFLICSVCVFVNLHTLWKYKLFAEFINHGAQFYEQFQNNFARRKEAIGSTKEDITSGLVKVAFFFFAIFSAFSMGVLYLYRCDNHLLTNVLPICEQGDKTFLVHKSTTVPILFIIQTLFYLIQFGSLILYIDLFVAVVLMGLYIAEQMGDSSTKDRRTLRKLQINRNWYPTFRCLHLIVLELNNCIGDVFMPVHLVVVILGSSFGIFIALRFYEHLSFVFMCLLAVFFVALALYYTVLMGRGSRFSEETENAILSRKLAIGDSKYYRRMFWALQPLRPAVGAFFPFQRHTVLTMIETFLDVTVELLLLEGI